MSLRTVRPSKKTFRGKANYIFIGSKYKKNFDKQFIKKYVDSLNENVI